MTSKKEFYSARELAEIARRHGLPGCPHSEREFNKMAMREGWNTLPEHLARPRPSYDFSARPGAEYHFSILPEPLRGVIVELSEQRARHLQMVRLRLIKADALLQQLTTILDDLHLLLDPLLMGDDE